MARNGKTKPHNDDLTHTNTQICDTTVDNEASFSSKKKIMCEQ